MADNKKPDESGSPEPESTSKDQQSVISRVSNLPLVSSACEAVSSAYSTTKESVPLLKGVMDVAESGVRTLGAAASTGAKPLLDMMEPQLTTANEYAMKGLDKVEEKMPVLHQPADKVVSDTVGKVRQSVAGAKEAVVEAMMGGVERTRAAVSSGIDTVMSTRMGQMVSSGMGLSRPDEWVDQNLPITERELAAVAEPATSEAATSSGSPSYFVRLGRLSDKVQARAFQHSLDRARHYRDATFATVGQIRDILDLLEAARSSLGSASKEMGASEKLLQRWTAWKQERGDEQAESEPDETKDESEQLESYTLSMIRDLSNQLRSLSTRVVSSVKGLPSAIQDHLTIARHSTEELYRSLESADTIAPDFLEQLRCQLTLVQKSVDGVIDYLTRNTPLNWLVGPFIPQISEEGDAAVEKPGPNK